MKEKIAREKKLMEAEKRLRLLNVPEETIDGFKELGLIPLTFNGIDMIYGIDKGKVDRITAFEDHYQATVYYVTFVSTTLGDMESYLFVSDYEEEWESDQEDIPDGYAMTWTENLSYPELSEFGSISLQGLPSGGVVRVG